MHVDRTAAIPARKSGVEEHDARAVGRLNAAGEIHRGVRRRAQAHAGIRRLTGVAAVQIGVPDLHGGDERVAACIHDLERETNREACPALGDVASNEVGGGCSRPFGRGCHEQTARRGRCKRVRVQRLAGHGRGTTACPVRATRCAIGRGTAAITTTRLEQWHHCRCVPEVAQRLPSIDSPGSDGAIDTVVAVSHDCKPTGFAQFAPCYAQPHRFAKVTIGRATTQHALARGNANRWSGACHSRPCASVTLMRVSLRSNTMPRIWTVTDRVR